MTDLDICPTDLRSCDFRLRIPLWKVLMRIDARDYSPCERHCSNIDNIRVLTTVLDDMNGEMLWSILEAPLSNIRRCHVFRNLFHDVVWLVIVHKTEQVGWL
jgi:hypothetical protein